MADRREAVGRDEGELGTLRSTVRKLAAVQAWHGIPLRYRPVPVVPVFIRGTYEAMPRGRFLRRLEQVTVSFGEPVDPDGLQIARADGPGRARACCGAWRTLTARGGLRSLENSSLSITAVV
jgi:hypothetical protein